jgi:hypothetical protein
VEIASWTHVSLPDTPTIFRRPLSSSQCDAITDYTALDLIFEG